MMRIIIELTEAEAAAGAPGITREVVGAAATREAGREGPAVDGGPPSEALLLALGTRGEARAEAPGGPSAIDAATPPAWLEEVIRGIEQGQP